jgi:hypothetical protein
MSSLLLLPGFVKKIESKRRSFLWSGKDSCAGAKCLVAWDRVCLDKGEGGLGVTNLMTRNTCLLLKLLHRLFTHYRNQSLCRVPEALGEALKTLGKEGSANSTSAKPSLPRAFSRALGKDLCRVPDSTRQRKAAVTAPGVGDGGVGEGPA